MAERLEVRNLSMAPVEADLVLELDADFADVIELAKERQQHGTVEASWDAAGRTVTFAEASSTRRAGLRKRPGSRWEGTWTSCRLRSAVS